MKNAFRNTLLALSALLAAATFGAYTSALAASPEKAASANKAASPDKDIYAGWLKPGPPPLERFIKPLALTLEQQQKLKPIFADAQQRAANEEAEKAKKGPDAHVVESGLLTREADFRVLLGTVLSADQLATYESLASAHDADARTLNPHPAHGHNDMSKPSPALVEPSEDAPKP